MLAPVVDAADGPLLQALSLGICREFLARRGYNTALSELDAARPPAEDDLTSRSDIVRELRLEPQLQANRKRAAPLRTLLEVLISSQLNRDDDEEVPRPAVPSVGAPLAATVSLPPPPPPQVEAVAAVTLPPPPPPQPVAAAAARPRPARPKSAHKGFRTPNVLPAGFGEQQGVGATSGGDADAAATSVHAAESPVVARPAKALAEDPPRHVELSDRRDSKLIVRPGELNGGVCELSGLVGCEVLVLDWSQQVIAC